MKINILINKDYIHQVYLSLSIYFRFPFSIFHFLSKSKLGSSNQQIIFIRTLIMIILNITFAFQRLGPGFNKKQIIVARIQIKLSIIIMQNPIESSPSI